MIRPFELFVGLRYTRARRRNLFISFISFISILGIVVGITALITVLSVMNGFGQELRGRILGFVSHVTITEVSGTLRNWRQVAQQLSGNADVLGRAPHIIGQGMLVHGKAASGVLVRGILPSEEPQVSDIDRKMTMGRLQNLRPGEFGIILGQALAWRLNASMGSRVSLVIPQALVTAVGVVPRSRRFTVVGIFNVDMYEYDRGWALIDIEDAAKLYRMQDTISGLRLKVADLDAAPRVSGEIETTLGPHYRARDWARQHVNFFRALKMEKTVMFVIMLLVIAVAGFNVVSTLVMVVTDKEADIAILRTLGASPGAIMLIFMVQGTVIGLIGTIIGTLCGIALAVNVTDIVQFVEALFDVTFLAPDVYYISELPSDVHVRDVVMIASASLAMGLLATLYPARRAAKVHPAEALRYE
ncbi:MAG: lipoprotein-releasing ABC transporter permease subunit [Acidiferrobacterales bacterium]